MTYSQQPSSRMPQPSPAWPPFREPFGQTLVRNFAIAATVGAALASQRHNAWLWLPLSVLALWFSLGGHYVEVLFLNRIRPRLPHARVAQVFARVVVWFAGGALLFELMAATARALPLHPPAWRFWWLGGLLLIGIELVVHAVLMLRKLPNFYNGLL